MSFAQSNELCKFLIICHIDEVIMQHEYCRELINATLYFVVKKIKIIKVTNNFLYACKIPTST
jgi:hypothetical protein